MIASMVKNLKKLNFLIKLATCELSYREVSM